MSLTGASCIHIQPVSCLEGSACTLMVYYGGVEWTVCMCVHASLVRIHARTSTGLHHMGKIFAWDQPAYPDMLTNVT